MTLTLSVIRASTSVVIIATRTLIVAAGRTIPVQISLNRAGRRLLAHAHQLGARLMITENRMLLLSRTVVLRATTHAHKHQHSRP